MADGFRVDVTALQKAAVGVADTIEAVSSHKVSDIDCDKSAFGHDHLAATVSDFCDRWQIGVEHLAKDGGEIADRLMRCVINYAKSDHAGGT
jgi:hypothetical protein